MDSASPTISPLRFLSGLETQTFLYLSVMRFPAPRVPRPEMPLRPRRPLRKKFRTQTGQSGLRPLLMFICVRPGSGAPLNCRYLSRADPFRHTIPEPFKESGSDMRQATKAMPFAGLYDSSGNNGNSGIGRSFGIPRQKQIAENVPGSPRFFRLARSLQVLCLCGNIEHYVEQYSAITGNPLISEEAMRTEERIYNMERYYNNLAGFNKREDDYLPKRFTEEPAKRAARACQPDGCHA